MREEDAEVDVKNRTREMTTGKEKRKTKQKKMRKIGTTEMRKNKSTVVVKC